MVPIHGIPLGVKILSRLPDSAHSAIMGNVFSPAEKKEIAPHFDGIQPVSLAMVIWDSINEEGMDSRDQEDGSIGISFDGDGSEAGKNSITFWDNGETTTLPKNVFLEIMKMTGEQVVKVFEDNYDLQRSKELGESVAVLKAALEQLEEHMSTIESAVSVAEYRRLVDSETELEEMESEDETPVAAALDIKVPVPPPPTDDIDADNSDSDDEVATPPPNHLLQRRRSTRGIEGVMDRLPELRRRFSDDEPETPTTPTSPAFDKVRKKVKLLSIFHIRRDEVSPEETTANKLPNPEEDDHAKPKPENSGDEDAKPDNTRVDAAKAAEKPRSSSVDNFFKDHRPAKHQFSTASLPGDLSSLPAKNQMLKLKQAAPTSPSSTPVPSLPGSIEDIFCKSPESTTPTSLGNLHIGFLTPSGSLDTPTPPESLSPTPPGGTGSKIPGYSASAAHTTTGSSCTHSSTPPEGTGKKLLGSNTSNKPPGSSKDKNLTSSSSLNTTPTPPPGAEANRSHFAWPNRLDPNLSGTPPVSIRSMGPHNIHSPECTDYSSTITKSLPGSVENSN